MHLTPTTKSSTVPQIPWEAIAVGLALSAFGITGFCEGLPRAVNCLCVAVGGTLILPPVIAHVVAWYKKRKALRALLEAIELNEIGRVEKILQERICDINGENEWGRTPLGLAVHLRRVKVAQLLAREGADLTPLNRLKERARVKVEQLSKELPKGSSPLTCLVSGRDLEGVWGLALQGVDLHAPDDNGFNAAKLAVNIDAGSMIKLLQELGVSCAPYIEIMRRKHLAHSWGIEGEMEVDGIKADLSGLPPIQGTRMLLDCVGNVPHLPYSLAGDLTRSDETLLRRVNEGQPTLIRGGTGAHDICYVIIGDEVRVCNRGARHAASSAGIMVYRKNSSQWTLEEIQKLRRRYETTSGLSLNLTYQHTIPLKDQKVGNCVWASLKTAVAAFLTSKHGTEQGIKLYKEFSARSRLFFLEKYLRESPCKSALLLSAIQTKFQEKIQRGIPGYTQADFGRLFRA